jgi:hypothetical protein
MIKMNQQSVPPFIFQSYKLHFVPPFIFSKLQATHEPTEPHTTGWAGEVCHTVFYNQVQQNLTEPTPHEQSMRKLWERIWPTAVLEMCMSGPRPGTVVPAGVSAATAISATTDSRCRSLWMTTSAVGGGDLRRGDGGRRHQGDEDMRS